MTHNYLILVFILAIVPLSALHASRSGPSHATLSSTTSTSASAHPNSITPISTPASMTPHGILGAPHSSSPAGGHPSTAVPGSILPNPEPTRQLPNPELNLTAAGRTCLQKCKDLQGVSCKKWDDDSITCCQFTGCQWPFYCNPDKRIVVQGCQNKP